MARYARIVAGVVAEHPIDLPDDLTPQDAFRPDIAETFVPCPDDAVIEGWLWDGSAFAAPAPVAATVPVSVTSAQAKIQLRRSGLRDKANEAAREVGGDVFDWFTDQRVWDRGSPNLAALAAKLSLKDADIDDLFVEASKIAA